MTRIYSHDKGDSTIEDMNNLASYLLTNDMAKCEENCGFQECSSALCDFEVHVIKKRRQS